MIFSALLADRAVLAITGPDARNFLQGLVTNNVLKLSAHETLYAAFLSPQGKYWHDFFICAEGETLWMDHAASETAALIKRLSLYKLRAKVTLALTDLQLWAEWGDAITPSRDPRHPALGVRRILSKEETEKITPTATLADYHRHRIGLGVPEGQYDMIPDKSLPLEYGLEALHGVDFAKGCYIGQEVTARMKHRLAVRKCIFKVSGQENLPAFGTPVLADTIEVGEMRSRAGNIGLAHLKYEVWNNAVTAGQTLMAANQKIMAFLPEWSHAPYIADSPLENS